MSGLKRRISNELRVLEEDDLLRRLVPPGGVDFSSNDYLGLSGDERLKAAFSKAIFSDGVGSTGSRLLRGDRNGFSKVEKEFADWKGTEASLYFSTGYQANIGVFQTFLKKGDVVFSDELNHASIIDGIKLGKAKKIVYPHLDYQWLEECLNSTECDGEVFVVSESLFSMDGDLAPLDKLAGVCRKRRANLIVDEAHAVGLYGAAGSGLIEEFDVSEGVFLSVNTAGKALGAAGAFVAGDGETIDYMINRCRAFIFSTAPLPAVASAIGCAIEIIRNDTEGRDELRELCGVFARLMQENGIDMSPATSHIVPLIIGESAAALRIAKEMQAKGFDVRAIRPPTVAAGTSRLRISLNTKLSESEIRMFAVTLSGIIKQENRT